MAATASLSSPLLGAVVAVALEARRFDLAGDAGVGVALPAFGDAGHEDVAGGGRTFGGSVALAARRRLVRAVRELRGRHPLLRDVRGDDGELAPARLGTHGGGRREVVA